MTGPCEKCAGDCYGYCDYKIEHIIRDAVLRARALRPWRDDLEDADLETWRWFPDTPEAAS